MDLKKEIRGFLDWLAYGKLLVDIVAAVFSAKGVKALLLVGNVSPLWISPIEWLVGLVVLILMLKYANKYIAREKSAAQPGTSLQSSMRTNALLRSFPANPGSFNSRDFFRVAYYSVLQDAAANSYREEAERVRAEDKESFYLDVLGIGTVSYGYDMIWWPIFKSQLLALIALNSSGGIYPKSKLREFYDAAAQEYQAEYADASFEEWTGYLENNSLFKIHPSDMVEITVKGKDFLKYLLHVGRSERSKRL